MGVFWMGMLKKVEAPKKEEARQSGEGRKIKGL